MIRIWLKYVPKDSIDNKSALVKVMVWCQTGNKPSPEPMLSQFTDEYMSSGLSGLSQDFYHLTLSTPDVVLPLFATMIAACTEGIWVCFVGAYLF